MFFENNRKYLLENLAIQQKLTIFVMSKGKELINILFHQSIFKMNNEKFKLRIIEVVRLLLDFRQMADKSDKRILRDTIRAVVKELTRV